MDGTATVTDPFPIVVLIFAHRTKPAAPPPPPAFPAPPFAALGLAASTAATSAAAFSPSASSLNDTLPSGACTCAPLSARNCTCPLRTAAIAAVTSLVTVPSFGFGMSPRGPRTRAMADSLGIIAGVAIACAQGAAKRAG